MIRLLQQEDIPVCVQLSKAMQQDSALYRVMDFDVKMVFELFVEALETKERICIVAEKKKEIVGFFYGVVSKSFLGKDFIARDYALYVAEKHRGYAYGAKLLLAFEKEVCRVHPNVRFFVLGISEDFPEAEKTSLLFERVGYIPAGKWFSKRV